MAEAADFICGGCKLRRDVESRLNGQTKAVRVFDSQSKRAADGVEKLMKNVEESLKKKAKEKREE